MLGWVLSWGGGCDEILAGFSLWCELQRESSVQSRFPAHPFVPRILPLPDVKTSWAQRSGCAAVSSGPLTGQFPKNSASAKQSGQEAVAQRRPSRSAPGVSRSTAERMGCGGCRATLSGQRLAGGAEVGPMLLGDCPRLLMSLRSERQTLTRADRSRNYSTLL